MFKNVVVWKERRCVEDTKKAQKHSIWSNKYLTHLELQNTELKSLDNVVMLSGFFYSNKLPSKCFRLIGCVMNTVSSWKSEQ